MDNWTTVHPLLIGAVIAIMLAIAAVTHWFTIRQRLLAQKSEQTARTLEKLNRQRESEMRLAIVNRLAEIIPAGSSVAKLETAIDLALARARATGTERSGELTAVEILVKSYHQQALGQANVQFVISVIAAIVGFIWILWAGSKIEPKELVTAGKILPGVIIDAVAYLFLKQAAETRQRATELFDRLRTDRRLVESMSVVALIEDDRLRGIVRSQIGLQMAGLTPQPLDVSGYLKGGAPTAG